MLRIKRVDAEAYPYRDLTFMLIGKNILNNPNIIRDDDSPTGDIVFYEKEKQNGYV